MKRKLRRLANVFGILTGIIVVLVPIIGIFVSGDIGIILLKSCVVLFVITMVCAMGAMLVDSNWIVKLAVLPIAYILIMAGYMIYQLKVHMFFIGALGGDVGDAAMAISEDVSVAKLSMALHGGAIVLSIPLIIVVILKATKLNKRHNIDFSTYNTTEGVITNVIDTRTRINKVKAYKITLEIPYYQGEGYQVTKEFLVPMHMIHTIALGERLTLKVNPKKREDIYIQNEYGIL